MGGATPKTRTTLPMIGCNSFSHLVSLVRKDLQLGLANQRESWGGSSPILKLAVWKRNANSLSGHHRYSGAVYVLMF